MYRKVSTVVINDVEATRKLMERVDEACTALSDHHSGKRKLSDEELARMCRNLDAANKAIARQFGDKLNIGGSPLDGHFKLANWLAENALTVGCVFGASAIFAAFVGR